MKKLLHERLRDKGLFSNYPEIVDEIERCYRPKVFDVNDVEINIEDIVWRIDPPIQPLKVIDLKYYLEGQPEVVCSEKGGKVIAHYSPNLLTHEEPDSWGWNYE